MEYFGRPQRRGVFCRVLLVLLILLGAPEARAQEASSTLQLANLQQQFQTIADRVAPSVVAISVAATAADSDDLLRADALNPDKLESILERTTRTVGTGFVIDSDGYILTNEHVIGQASHIWITTDDRKVYPAIVVGSDPRADLAVLKTPARDLKPVTFGDGRSAHRGMWTIALGNPYGIAGVGNMCMSVGVVSATERSLPKLSSQENRFYSNLIQTTAEINPGNSGGPLFNIDGEVIGVSTAVIMPQKSTNGIGFALPITPELLQRVQDLKEGREIVYAYLGVMVSTPTAVQRREAGIKEMLGVMIDKVELNSPAERALKPGDIVLKFNDQPVAESEDFIRMVGNMSVAQPAKFTLTRGGQPVTLYVQLRRRDLPSTPVHRDNQRIRWRGMLLGPIPANWKLGADQKPESGLMVIGVDRNNPAVPQGVRSGDIIRTIAGKTVNTIVELQNLLNETPESMCSLELVSQPTQAVVSGQ